MIILLMSENLPKVSRTRFPLPYYFGNSFGAEDPHMDFVICTLQEAFHGLVAFALMGKEENLHSKQPVFTA